MGKKSYKYVWIFDQLKKKCQEDMSVDISSSQFEIDNHYITLMDAPGNRYYLKSITTGISLVSHSIKAFNFLCFILFDRLNVLC